MSEQAGRFILEPEAVKYLAEYDIPYPEHELAPSAEAAAAAAARLGYPVVLKVVSAEVSHKSDVGGVVVGLDNLEAVKDGFEKMTAQVKAAVPEARIEGALVCRQAPPGLEVIVGALEDPVFGPTVMFGLGGVFTEVLRDVVFRIAPLKRLDAAEMIQEIKGYPLLQGARGGRARDVAALRDLLVGVSRLVTDRPKIKELDLNPVRLFAKGLVALDVRVIEKDTSPG